MRREGGTTLTSLTSASAIAKRRFSLLLPFGYAFRERKGTLFSKQAAYLYKNQKHTTVNCLTS